MGAAEQAFELPLARELRNGAAHGGRAPYIAEPVEGPVDAGADLWRKHLEVNRGR